MHVYVYNSVCSRTGRGKFWEETQNNEYVLLQQGLCIIFLCKLS